MSLIGLAALVLSLVAFHRTGALDALTRRIAELEAEVALLRRRSASAVDPPTDAETPVPEVALPPWPEAAAQTEDTLPPRDQAPPADAPSVASPVPPSTPPPASPRPTIDWERWVGVQGAAVLGGAVLALAGLLFFRYSIEHGLISPSLRVILGTLVGLVCVVAPERRWRTVYPDAANALSGAGLVILYGSFWAAHTRYGLIGSVPAFGLMALVTAAGCVLSVRHDSLLVAALGLIGGFATPFLLASDVDRPVGLFGYILLLDTALLVVARRRGWPLLALASLVGTVLYQAVWVGQRLSPPWSMFALAMLGLFALLFALGSPQEEGGKRPTWFATQAAAILLPFAFGIYLAGNARLAIGLYPLAGLLVLLSAAAAWIGRQQGRPWLALGAAAGVVAVLAVSIIPRLITTGAGAWEAALSACAVALVFHLFAERDGRNDMEGTAPAATIAAVGLLTVLIVGALGSPVPPWPWIAGWLALAGLLVRSGTCGGREFLQPIAAGEVALGLVFIRLVHGADPFFPAPTVHLALIFVVAILFQLAALVQTPSLARRRGEEAAALAALLLLVSLVDLPARGVLPAAVFLTGALGLGFLAALAATRMDSGDWYLAAVAATAWVHTVWVWSAADVTRRAMTGLVLAAGAVALFTAWPFLTARRFRADVRAWWASALAGPLWFLALHTLYEQRFGAGWIGILPLVLAAVALVAAGRARSLWPATDPLRTSALVWFSAVALGFVSLAIPLQLAREWITIGWALEAFAVTLLWRRLDHPGLKYFALALIVGVTVRLVGNPAVLGYYPRPAWRIVNWLLYTYGVPAAAFLAASSVLAAGELPRLRAWERNPIYERKVPLVATAAGLAAILIVFVWINLAIADWFADGPMLRMVFERLPARDLTTSLAWALYALVLLAVGMVRGTSGLRWLSLGFLVLTIGKVFLYDLGTLRDLYRVVSLLGLAFSLILVSLAYQRFVFRRTAEEGE